MVYLEHRAHHDYQGEAEVPGERRLDDHRGHEYQDNWVPYEQDLSMYPEVFKKYTEDLTQIDRLNEKLANHDPLAENPRGPFEREFPVD